MTKREMYLIAETLCYYRDFVEIALFNTKCNVKVRNSQDARKVDMMIRTRAGR